MEVGIKVEAIPKCHLVGELNFAPLTNDNPRHQGRFLREIKKCDLHGQSCMKLPAVAWIGAQLLSHYTQLLLPRWADITTWLESSKCWTLTLDSHMLLATFATAIGSLSLELSCFLACLPSNKQ
jgi:hypothetical protein